MLLFLGFDDRLHQLLKRDISSSLKSATTANSILAVDYDPGDSGREMAHYKSNDVLFKIMKVKDGF